MLIIRTEADLDRTADPPAYRFLDRYRDLLPLATIYVVEGGEGLTELAQARCRPFADWEFIIEHPDGWYEAVMVISDYGEGDVVLIANGPDTDADLLELCRANAVPAEQLTDL